MTANDTYSSERSGQALMFRTKPVAKSSLSKNPDRLLVVTSKSRPVYGTSSDEEPEIAFVSKAKPVYGALSSKQVNIRKTVPVYGSSSDEESEGETISFDEEILNGLLREDKIGL